MSVRGPISRTLQSYPGTEGPILPINIVEKRKPDPQVRPLRVCLLVDTVKHDAGTEKLVAEFAKRLEATRFEVHVCCFEDSARLADLPSHVRTKIFPVGRLYSLAGLRQVWKFRQYIKQNRIDAVHGFMNKSGAFAVLAAIRSRCPAVITSRLNTGYWYTPRLLRFFPLLNRWTTHIFTNSACAKDITVRMEGVSPDRVTVVYPGVDLLRYASSSGICKRQHY